MKLKTEWWKLSKQLVVMVVGALCLVGLSGCGGDDDGDGDWVGTWSMYQVSEETWQLTVSIDGESESVSFEMPGDLSDLEDGYYDLGSGMSMTISGNSIVIEAYDSSVGTLRMTGTIPGDYQSVEGDIYLK
ncbi:hypothetical protein [Pontiella sp.]|uniref:hypothetical protein n=1 Tax=Pontiella sp. TaxID=2837462 RepID=UPI00356A98CA